MAGERLEHALKRYRKRYRAGDRSERSGVLDEFCELTGYHRKYAISLLNNVNDEPLQTSSERSSIWTDETRYPAEASDPDSNGTLARNGAGIYGSGPGCPLWRTCIGGVRLFSEPDRYSHPAGSDMIPPMLPPP